ncbi:uncharacterized protein LOC129773211 [Toxorhynchites rutilus septentrionalis]|uniref:uncharacterized protein LOC129773211 n=1 Tax=Toxorhynchites rutilus septentrionalis TaxID=329112 RepID=UPI002478B14E|nr:uncharacterized protein LOC129773211 [Toxorhynchites rutilus septentrionalis]
MGASNVVMDVGSKVEHSLAACVRGAYDTAHDTVPSGLRERALKEMHCRQTKENLTETLEYVLNQYGVKLNQIYSVAHDNGSNMVATVGLLKKMLEKPNLNNCPPINLLLANEEACGIFEHADDTCNDTDDDDDNEAVSKYQFCTPSNSALPANDFFDKNREETRFVAPGEENDDYEFEGILDSTRCAAHTAQLAVWDVIRPYKERIAKIQGIVVKLRNRKYHKCFKTHDAHLPPIANDTRWNGKYLMVASLLKQRQFFNLLNTSFPETDLTQHWPFIEKFCEAFEPAFILTLKLQKVHCALSEFYTYWLQCQANLDKLKANEIAVQLLETFKTRAQKLVSTLQFKACMYLDPRYNFLGARRISTEDKAKVQLEGSEGEYANIWRWQIDFQPGDSGV